MNPDDVAKLLAGQSNMLTTPPPNIMPNTQLAMIDEPNLTGQTTHDLPTGFGGGGGGRNLFKDLYEFIGKNYGREPTPAELNAEAQQRLNRRLYDRGLSGQTADSPDYSVYNTEIRRLREYLKGTKGPPG